MILYPWVIMIMLKTIKSEEMLLPRRTWYMNDEGFFEEILVNGKTVKGRYHQIMDDGSIGLPICTKDCEGCSEIPPGRACAHLCEHEFCVEEEE